MCFWLGINWDCRLAIESGDLQSEPEEPQIDEPAEVEDKEAEMEEIETPLDTSEKPIITSNAKADYVLPILEARRLLRASRTNLQDPELKDDDFELQVVKIDKPTPVKPAAVLSVEERNQQLIQLAQQQYKQRQADQDKKLREILEEKRIEKEQRRMQKEALESLKLESQSLVF